MKKSDANATLVEINRVILTPVIWTILFHLFTTLSRLFSDQTSVK